MVPRQQQKKKLVKQSHFDHIRKTKMMLIIYTLRFKWRGLRQQINRYIQECQVCCKVIQKTNQQPNKNRNRWFFSFPGVVFEMDYVMLNGEIESKLGKKYLLNIIDFGSKFAWSFAFNNKSTNNVINSIEKIIQTRKPIQIRSDNGRQFQNEQLKVFLQRNKIVQSFGLPYYPQGQGTIQRFNKTIQKFLSFCVIQNRCLSSFEFNQLHKQFIKKYNYQWPHNTSSRIPKDLINLNHENPQDLKILLQLKQSILRKKKDTVQKQLFENGSICLMMSNFKIFNSKIIPDPKRKKINARINAYELPVKIIGFSNGLYKIAILVNDYLQVIKKDQQYQTKQQLIILAPSKYNQLQVIQRYKRLYSKDLAIKEEEIKEENCLNPINDSELILYGGYHGGKCGTHGGTCWNWWTSWWTWWRLQEYYNMIFQIKTQQNFLKLQPQSDWSYQFLKRVKEYPDLQKVRLFQRYHHIFQYPYTFFFFMHLTITTIAIPTTAIPPNIIATKIPVERPQVSVHQSQVFLESTYIAQSLSKLSLRIGQTWSLSFIQPLLL